MCKYETKYDRWKHTQLATPTSDLGHICILIGTNVLCHV